MKIDKNTVGLTAGEVEGIRYYEFAGDLTTVEDLIIDLDACFCVNGNLSADGDILANCNITAAMGIFAGKNFVVSTDDMENNIIRARSINVRGDLRCGKIDYADSIVAGGNIAVFGIDADADLTAGGDIVSADSIYTKNNIYAGGNITAKGDVESYFGIRAKGDIRVHSLKAGWSIYSAGQIEVARGIIAGGEIAAGSFISAGGLIFAGASVYSNAGDMHPIKCAKLSKGTIAYGDLVIDPPPVVMTVAEIEKKLGIKNLVIADVN